MNLCPFQLLQAYTHVRLLKKNFTACIDLFPWCIYRSKSCLNCVEKNYEYASALRRPSAWARVARVSTMPETRVVSLLTFILKLVSFRY